MTNKKSLKRALILNVLSTLLCVSMLLGTTFAWFTDTVESGVNQIVAGNLDVTVEYSKSGSDWETLQGANSIFQTDKWEPGTTDVVYLRVANVGDLALKYQLAVYAFSEITSTSVEGNEIKLSEILEFGMTAAGSTLTTYSDRAAARVAAEDANNSLTLGSYSEAKTLLPTAAGAEQAYDYFALVVYMPTITGNEANYAKADGYSAPSIDLGIKIVATQYEHEADSFDNTYDSGLTNDTALDATVISSSISATKKVTSGQATVITAGSTQATISADAVNNATELTLVVEETTETSDGGYTINTTSSNATSSEAAYYDISLKDQNDEVVHSFVTDGFADVELYIGTDLIINEVYHKAAVLTTDSNQDEYYSYDASTGILTLHVTSFSPFSIGYDEAVARIDTTYYKTFTDAWTAAKNSSYDLKLLSDVTLNALLVCANYSIDLNGKTLTLKGHPNAGDGGAIYIDGGGNYDSVHGRLTIKNGTLNMNATGFAQYGIYNYGTLTLKDIIINSACTYAIEVNGQAWGSVGTTTLDNVIINNTATSGYGLHALSLKSFSTIQPTVIIRNSNITSLGDAVSLLAVNCSIENSTFAGNNNSLYIGDSAMASGVTGTVSLSGEINLNAGTKLNKNGNHTLNIISGSYNFNPTDYVDIVSFDVTENDGIWTVTAK